MMQNIIVKSNFKRLDSNVEVQHNWAYLTLTSESYFVLIQYRYSLVVASGVCAPLRHSLIVVVIVMFQKLAFSLKITKEK